jgi:cbb3-type cytochrome oxidase subunit 3
VMQLEPARILAAATPITAAAPIPADAAPAASDAGLWPTVSMLFFLAVFLGVIAWLIFSKKERWARDASIPLSETPVEPRSSASAQERSR